MVEERLSIVTSISNNAHREVNNNPRLRRAELLEVTPGLVNLRRVLLTELTVELLPESLSDMVKGTLSDLFV